MTMKKITPSLHQLFFT